MKVKITHMGAPWPEGAGVGSLVAFSAGSIPLWAVGKCVEDASDDEAQFAWEAPAVSSEPAQPPLPPGVAEALSKAAETSASLHATVEAQAQALAALQATVDEFKARAAAVAGELVVNPAIDGDPEPAAATPARNKRAQAATG